MVVSAPYRSQTFVDQSMLYRLYTTYVSSSRALLTECCLKMPTQSVHNI